MDQKQLLEEARSGDINAFHQLFAGFQRQLKSYLYRLLAGRTDADDIAQDTFIRAFERIAQYRGGASLKTWVFQIATNLARDRLRERKRWSEDVSERAKNLVLGNDDLRRQLEDVARTSAYGTYEIREHIDTCFTCMGKTLPLENQVVLILKDVYDFAVLEIVEILGVSEGSVKHLLQSARTTMMSVFESRCALVNKEGVCHQCSELNGWFNPTQNQQEALVRITMARESPKYDREKLYELRIALIRGIDPLREPGNELQEALLDCNRLAMGEPPVVLGRGRSE